LAAEQAIFDQAIADFEKALAIDANSVEARRSLAWLLATCPDPLYRNPDQALTVAEQAEKLAPDDYLTLDVLAAAYASAGRFNDAVPLGKRALAAAPPQMLPQLRERLAMYERGAPFIGAMPSDSQVRAALHEEPAESRPAIDAGSGTSGAPRPNPQPR
jgi:tetratricopeptide (TPR) repeat protein